MNTLLKLTECSTGILMCCVHYIKTNSGYILYRVKIICLPFLLQVSKLHTSQIFAEIHKTYDRVV